MKTITLELPDHFPVMALAIAMHSLAKSSGHELKSSKATVWQFRQLDPKPVLACVRLVDPDNRDPGDEQPQSRAALRIVKDAAVIAA